ncbi:cytochrome-c peroxidase [bacterium]|nr:cytochrome-c peroxidase [bacterium]
MSPFNKIAIAIAIALFAILMIWPLLQQDGIEANSKHSVLTEDYLGDGSSPIIPIPLSMDLDQGKIELGEQLFNDPILSSNGFSCASCHPLSSAGMDGLKLSLTSSGGSDQMNTPTVFNSGFNALQLWNGKVDTLEQQTHNVIHNPQHMNASWPRILDRLQLNPHYLKQFNALYADGLNSDNIINAIVTFERSLITPNADFDQYLRGNMEAITNDQKKGYCLHARPYFWIPVYCRACRQFF